MFGKIQKKKVEMGETCTTSIDEVVGHDAEEIVDLKADKEQIFGVYLRNGKTFSTNFDNFLVILKRVIKFLW